MKRTIPRRAAEEGKTLPIHGQQHFELRPAKCRAYHTMRKHSLSSVEDAHAVARIPLNDPFKCFSLDGRSSIQVRLLSLLQTSMVESIANT